MTLVKIGNDYINPAHIIAISPCQEAPYQTTIHFTNWQAHYRIPLKDVISTLETQALEQT